MPVPLYVNVKAKNLDTSVYGNSNPIYTESYTKTANFDNKFKIYGLTPSYSYRIFCYTEN